MKAELSRKKWGGGERKKKAFLDKCYFQSQAFQAERDSGTLRLAWPAICQPLMSSYNTVSHTCRLLIGCLFLPRLVSNASFWFIYSCFFNFFFYFKWHRQFFFFSRGWEWDAALWNRCGSVSVTVYDPTRKWLFFLCKSDCERLNPVRHFIRAHKISCAHMCVCMFVLFMR